MRIVIGSNAPFAGTGYGTQVKQLVPRLRVLGHEVAVHAWYGLEGGILAMDGVTMYPKYRHGYGNDIVGAHANHFKADIVITLIDAWVLDAAMVPPHIKFCPWFPVDMEPIPPPVLNVVKDAYQPIVYSRFGERMARNAGLDVRYVPHGIDCQVFSPGDKTEARERCGLPKDAFIVGMVAANKGNPSRKAFPEQLTAFAQFARRHTDAVLYLHTNKGVDDGMGGVNLPELINYLEISDRVIFPDPYGQILGYPEAHMVALYRSFDVLLSVSRGEGFGIPIVEAQACGTPVIVGDWTSMPELCFGGWGVHERVPDYTPLAAYQYVPGIDAIRDCIKAAYHEAGARREQARAGALAYDADLVARDYWRPVLAEIEHRLTSERKAVAA